MATTTTQYLPLPGDHKLITVNGKKYICVTAEICTQCAAEQRYLFVKMQLSGGEMCLECPICELVVTKRAEQVNFDLDKI